MEVKSEHRYAKVSLPTWLQERLDKENKLREEKAAKQAAAEKKQKEKARLERMRELRVELEDHTGEFSFE